MPFNKGKSDFASLKGCQRSEKMAARGAKYYDTFGWSDCMYFYI